MTEILIDWLICQLIALKAERDELRVTILSWQDGYVALHNECNAVYAERDALHAEFAQFGIDAYAEMDRIRASNKRLMTQRDELREQLNNSIPIRYEV